VKVLISSDMEGITNVVNFSQIIAMDYGGVGPFRPSPDFELIRRQGVAEINAEIEGALAAGATEIIVNEAHDGMRNFLP
jgi:D-amino peptidase